MKILAICGSHHRGNTYFVLNTIQDEFPDIDYELLMLNSARYEVRENTVIHHIEVCDFPNWVGEDSVRYFKVTEDKLTLIAPSMLMEGLQQTVVATWQRIAN